MKSIKTISIKCETKDYLDWHNITEFQGGLKIRDEADIEKAKTSILKYGWSFPFFVWVSGKTNYCLDGHARIKVLKALEEEGYLIPELPVVYIQAKNKTEAKQKLLRLNSNFGHFTKESVLEFAEDIELNFDEIALPDTVIDFTDQSGEIAETEGDDEAPEVDEKSEPVSKRGEMYELGNSILMCGDSTDAEDVARLMGGEKADMVFTSPPYNGNTELPQGDVFARKGKKKLYDNGYSDDLNSDSYINFCKNVLNLCFENTDGFIYWNVNYNSNSKYEYIKQIEDKLEYLIEQICWKKTSAMPLKGVMRRAWEPIYIFSTSKKNLGLQEVVSNYWEVSNTNVQIENHKACFPVELPKKGIEITPKKTGIVFEPFGGSGSTLIAAEKLGRSCRIMELDPKYCDVIRRRYTKWAKENGKPITSGCLDY